MDTNTLEAIIGNNVAKYRNMVRFDTNVSCGFHSVLIEYHPS